MNLFLDPSRRVLKEGALPSINLPVKSVETTESKARSTDSIKKREIARNIAFEVTNFEEFKKHFKKSHIGSWQSEDKDSAIIFKYFEDPFVVPKFEVIVDSELKVIILYIEKIAELF